MQTYTRILSASFLVAITAPLATADGFYVDGSYNGLTATLDFEIANSDNDVSLSAIGLRGGYDVSPIFALEGEVLIGTADDTWYVSPGYSETDTTVHTYDVSLNSSVSAFGRANFPIAERLTAFARVGYSAVEFETDDSFVDAFFGPAFGVGATFDVTDKIYLRGDITRYDAEEFENDAVSVGAGFRF